VKEASAPATADPPPQTTPSGAPPPQGKANPNQRSPLAISRPEQHRAQGRRRYTGCAFPVAVADGAGSDRRDPAPSPAATGGRIERNKRAARCESGMRKSRNKHVSHARRCRRTRTAVETGPPIIGQPFHARWLTASPCPPACHHARQPQLVCPRSPSSPPPL